MKLLLLVYKKGLFRHYIHIVANFCVGELDIGIVTRAVIYSSGPLLRPCSCMFQMYMVFHLQYVSADVGKIKDALY